MGLRRAAHVAWRRVGDETVLIHLKTKKMYVLNPSAGFFWHQLDGAHGSSELLAELTVETPLPEGARGQLDAFFDKLESADLVEAATEDATDNAANGSNAQPYPLETFVPPDLVWQDELRNFGQSCAREPGEDTLCNMTPTF